MKRLIFQLNLHFATDTENGLAGIEGLLFCFFCNFIF